MSPHDEGQREIARNRLDRSIVVTAGAGSGKTRELVSRYLNLIQKEHGMPHQILALTFTNKAAAEMKKRIRREFQGEISIGTELAFAPVMTFHAFCTTLLREFAIEAGVDPDFRILDDAEKKVLEEKAFFDLLQNQKSEAERTALTTILTIYGKSQLQKILRELTEHGDTCHHGFFEQDKQTILIKWQALLDPIREQAVIAFFTDAKTLDALHIIRNAGNGMDSSDKAVQYFDSIRPLITNITKDTPNQELTQVIAKILSSRLGNSGSKKIWGAEELQEIKSVNVFLRNRLEKLQTYLKLTIDPDAAHTNVALEIIRYLRTVSQGYSHRLKEEMRKDGSLRFSDLISITKQFLEDNPQIVEGIQKRYPYIFIDEFQDTDPAQFEIISSIIGSFEECRGLFIVGDPNQSIYLFRDADVTLFGQAQDIFGNSDAGEVVEFSVCFRSTPEIIECVNYVFSELFSANEKPWEFPHTKTHVSEKRCTDQGSVQLLLAGEADSNETIEIAKQKEAALIVKTIKTFFQTNTDYTPKDIAILIEKRTHLATYLSALEKAGLPFIVGKGLGFYTLPEVLDLYSALAFICTAHDDCVLLAVLRSPYFSLSDRSITILALRSEGLCLWDKLCFAADSERRDEMEQLFGEEYGRVISAQKQLDEWILIGWTRPLQRTIHKMLSTSQIYEIYCALPNGEQKIANLRKFIDIILERSADMGYGIVQAVADIKESMQSEEREGEAERARSDAISVMTIHAAKGLEFPVVLLAGLSDAKTGDNLPICIGTKPEEFGITVPDPDADYEMKPTPVFTSLRLVHEEKELAERKRLLYVGMTRARDHLILSGTRPKKKISSISEGKSKMDWLCSIFNIDPQQPPSEVIFGQIAVPVVTDNEDESEYAEGEQQEQRFIHGEEIYRRRIPTRAAQQKRGTAQIQMSSLKGEIQHTSEQKGLLLPGAARLQPEQVGILMHEIFSGISADVILKKYNIYDEKTLNVCQGYYEKFKTLPILDNLHEEYTELSCSLFLPDIDVKLQGKIDRLCKTDNGWVIIDYKTGTADHKEFQPVLEAYCRAAERLVKEPVTAYLYEITSHMLIPVTRMEDDAFSSLVAAKARELLS